MTTPQSVRYTLGCMYTAIDDLLAEDFEERDGRGRESLALTKVHIRDAIAELNRVIKQWDGE